jgi:hypothetical protein
MNPYANSLCRRDSRGTRSRRRRGLLSCHFEEGEHVEGTDSEEDWMAEWDAQVADEEIVTCHICGQTFPTQVELSQHLMDDHDDEGLPTPGPSESRE